MPDSLLCCCRSGNLGMSHTKGRGAWALVSLTGIAVSCLGAILLPFFDILAAIMGALGNLVAAYALPALFVLVSMLYTEAASCRLRAHWAPDGADWHCCM